MINSSSRYLVSQDGSMASSTSSVEQAIKSLLEKFVESDDDLKRIEGYLKDYDSNEELVEIVTKMFLILQEKVEHKILNKLNTNSSVDINDQYQQLEKQIQKLEQEVRTHIRLEQQLRLYAESLQQKLEDCEKEKVEISNSTKKIINDLKKENQHLIEKFHSKIDFENIPSNRTNIPQNSYQENENSKIKSHMKVTSGKSKDNLELLQVLVGLTKRQKSSEKSRSQSKQGGAQMNSSRLQNRSSLIQSNQGHQGSINKLKEHANPKPQNQENQKEIDLLKIYSQSQQQSRENSQKLLKQGNAAYQSKYKNVKEQIPNFRNAFKN